MQRAGYLIGKRAEGHRADDRLEALVADAIHAGRVSVERPVGMTGKVYEATTTIKRVGSRTITITQSPRYIKIADGVWAVGYMIKSGRDKKFKAVTVISSAHIGRAAA